MGYITGGGRFSMIKVASLLLQIYDWLLITSLNLTVTNRHVSESFYKRLRLPGFPPPPVLFPTNFQSCNATGPNVSQQTGLAANSGCQYTSGLIHQLSHFITAVLLLHFTARRLDFALSARTAARFHPSGHSLKGEVG